MPAYFSGVRAEDLVRSDRAASGADGDYSNGPGPITRTVADAALMLRITAGPSSLDHTVGEAPPQHYPATLATSMRGKRIAWSPDLGHGRVSREVTALIKAAALRSPDWRITGKSAP